MRVQVYDNETHTWPEAWYKNLLDWSWDQPGGPLESFELVESELKKYGGKLSKRGGYVDFDDGRCYTLILLRWA